MSIEERKKRKRGRCNEEKKKEAKGKKQVVEVNNRSVHFVVHALSSSLSSMNQRHISNIVNRLQMQ
jgi:hypothetical protein